MVQERKFWNPKMETMPLEEKREIQLKRLKMQVQYSYEYSPLERKLMDEAGVKPGDINTIEDFQERIPIMRKDDVRAYRDKMGDPFGGLLAIPLEKCYWITTSPGTTGVPTFSGLTCREMEIIGEAVARIFWMWGLRPGDKIQMGMPAWHKSQYGHEMGARTLGATLVGSTMYPIEAARVLIIQKYLRTEALVLPMGPPLLTALREEMRRLGFDPKDVWKGCKWIVSSGESYTDATLKKLEDEWGTKIYDIAGPGSELSAGVGECPVTRRLNHFPDDVAFLEIVDPATGKPSLPGERGELVWTHLWFESFPFLRWGAEDIGYLLTDPCPCGRTGTRHRMLDRMAFQIKVRGKTVLPYDIREVTEAIPETAEGILQLYDYAPQMDTLRIRLSYEPEKTKDVNELRNRLAQSIENKLSLSTEIELIEPWQLDKLGIIPHKYLRIIKG